MSAVKLFRWEKEEKIPSRNKLWVVAALAPFLVMGGCRAFTRERLGDNQALYRHLRRSGSFLIRNARIFTAAGKTIESGAVLVRDGKIAEIYEGAWPDPQTLKAEAVEGAGKTLLPGLIDVHVHLGFARRRLDGQRGLRRRRNPCPAPPRRCSIAA